MFWFFELFASYNCFACCLICLIRFLCVGFGVYDLFDGFGVGCVLRVLIQMFRLNELNGYVGFCFGLWVEFLVISVCLVDFVGLRCLDFVYQC